MFLSTGFFPKHPVLKMTLFSKNIRTRTIQCTTVPLLISSMILHQTYYLHLPVLIRLQPTMSNSSRSSSRRRRRCSSGSSRSRSRVNGGSRSISSPGGNAVVVVEVEM